MNLQEEVVDLSGDESEHWCEVWELVYVVTVLDLWSLVNVVCDLDLCLVSDSDCEFVKPQTCSLSKNVMDCETKMNIEEPPVKVVPEAVWNKPTPQSSLFKAVPECVNSANANLLITGPESIFVKKISYQLHYRICFFF